MRIDLLAANDPVQTATTAPLRTLWRVGAILEATAVRDVATGELSLTIDNRRLPARLASGNSAGPLDGEQLKLRVLRNSPVLALESLEEDSSAGDISNEALRRYLPRQASPTPLLANLGWLARAADNRTLLPNSVNAALAGLWQSLPDAAALSDPKTLQHALQLSGGFLEAQLARATNSNSADIRNDFKAQLLSLREQLKAFKLSLPTSASTTPAGPLPMLQNTLSAMPTGPASLAVLDSSAAQLGELKQQTEGALARLNTTQLVNASAAQSGATAWLIEVPIRRDERAELLRFKFEREARRQPGVETGWSVEVAMDLGLSGALHAQVTLSGSRLGIKLRSDSATLVAALTHELDILRSALQSQGLEIDHLVCLHGSPVDDARSRLNHLLDLHA